MTNRLHARFLELLRIPGPSGKEERVAEYLINALTPLGFACETDEHGNLFGFREGRGEPVLLCAHMDTVALAVDPEPVIADGAYRAGGGRALGADDRAGIAVALTAIEELVAGEAPPTLEVFFSSAEEAGLVGSRRADLTRIRSRSGFVLDGSSDPGVIVLESPYKMRYDVVFTGRSAHAAINPEDGISAIAMAARAVEGILAIPKEGLVANIGGIHGGEATNVVCDRVTMCAEARCYKKAPLDRYTAQFEECLKRAAADFGGGYTLELDLEFEGTYLPEETPAVRRFRAACEAAGVNYRAGRTMGGTDANNLAKYGVTAMCLGIGAKNPHSPGEYITMEHLEQTLALVLRYLRGEDTD